MHRSKTLTALCPMALLFSLACSSPMSAADEDMAGPADQGGDTPDMRPAQTADMASTRPKLGQPIDVPKGSWQWVDFPDAVCDDGKPTGIGVRLTGSQDLLVFFMGGGACWDNTTCLVLNTASHGPFGKGEFDAMKGQLGGSVLDPAEGNDFRDYNMVFVPYCTGDLHAGDKVNNYTRPYHHKGRANTVAFFSRLAATIDAPRKLVISGSSAGGYGASLNYDLARSYWPDAKQSYLVNDSGPVFIGDAIAAQLRNAWWDAWGLGETLGKFCATCKDDVSAAIPLLVQKYPRDRMALLSSLQDRTIRTYLLMSAQAFEMNLNQLAEKRLDPTANFRYFFISGESHTMLGKPAGYKSQSTALPVWLKSMVGDSAEWKSTKP